MPRDVKRKLEDLPEVDAGVQKTSEYYRRNVVPVDRGWAWVICFAGFLVYFVFGISNQTLVVLFVEIIGMYGATVTMGSLVFMFSVFSVGTMSIISTNFLAPRFGERAVVSVAGFFNMCGSLGLSFSPTIGAFIIWAVLKGLATGAVFVPSISLIRLYFLNRRSLAQIMANVGQSAAVIIAPPIIRIIRKEYGISGTFIVIASVELHMTVAGLLLRPISAYKYRPRIERKASVSKAMEEVMISEDYNEFQLDPKYKSLGKKSANSQDGDTSKPSSFNRKSFLRSLTMFRRSGDDVDSAKSVHKSIDRSAQPGSSDDLKKKPVNDSQNILRANDNYTSKQSSKQVSGNTSDDGEVVEIPEDKEVALASETAPTDVITDTPVVTTDADDEATGRRWLFRMVLLATIPGSANLYVRNYIPAITKGQGATLDQSALLLTIVGGVDLVSRLCIGLFADLHILTSVQIIIVTQLCLASVCHCLRFFTNYQTLIVFVVLIGCFVGTRISVLPLLSIEIVGVENMPQALSVISTIGALSSAFMNPAFGAVAETDGDYVHVMNMVGGCFTLSSAILISMPFALRLRKYLRARKAKRSLKQAAAIEANDAGASSVTETATGVRVDTPVDSRRVKHSVGGQQQ